MRSMASDVTRTLRPRWLVVTVAAIVGVANAIATVYR